MMKIIKSKMKSDATFSMPNGFVSALSQDGSILLPNHLSSNFDNSPDSINLAMLIKQGRIIAIIITAYTMIFKSY